MPLLPAESSMVTDISSWDIAAQLKNGLDPLGRELQVLVELGHV